MQLTLEEALAALDSARKYPRGCGWKYFADEPSGGRRSEMASPKVVEVCQADPERVMKYGCPEVRVLALRGADRDGSCVVADRSVGDALRSVISAVNVPSIGDYLNLLDSHPQAVAIRLEDYIRHNFGLEDYIRHNFGAEHLLDNNYTNALKFLEG